MALPLRRNTEVLRDFVQIADQCILDIGCGSGALVRWLRKHGAFAIGLDPQANLLTAPAIAGLGDALPLADKSFDCVIFFNSLHHVPVPAMDEALREAARVARAQVIVVEPIASGSHFEMVQPVDDETEIRAAAYMALNVSKSLEVTAEVEWQLDYVEEDFDAFAAGMVRVDPTRQARIDQSRDELKSRFYAFGRKTEAGYAFDQPMRLNALRPRS